MITTPAYCRIEAFEAFRHHLREADTPAGLFRAACAISLHAHPEESIEAAEQVIARIAATVEQRLHTDSDDARLAHLHDVLFDVIGFNGNDENYFDPANSYLPIVLRKHRGIPISLVLIYRTVATRLGLRVHGINAPGHFLAAVACRENGDQRLMYVDPFYDGALLTSKEAHLRIESAVGKRLPVGAELLHPATPNKWLARMLMNLQAIFSRQGAERDLYAMQELHTLVIELDR